MNADRINEHYYGDPADAATERARQRIHWMCGQAVGHEILDIGCSQGILCLILGREGFRCVGVDIESASLDVARQALEQEDKIVQRRVTFEVADACQLPFEDLSFDTVVLGEVLEHFTHPVKVLSEAKRVLRDGGRLIVTVPYGLNAFHDHKRTYYPISLLELLQPLFRTTAIDTLGNYIIYIGAKDPAYDPAELCAEVLFEDCLRLAKTVQIRCLEKERALFETTKALHAKIKTVTAKVTAQADTIKELKSKIGAKDGRLRDITLTSPRAGQSADAQREVATQRERRLRETNRELQDQVEALTAKAAFQAMSLEELESELRTKERQIRELDLDLNSERELHARYPETAAKREQALLETNGNLQEQVKELTARKADQERRLDELQKSLAAKVQQIDELELAFEQARELADRHREKAARKEREWMEPSARLFGQFQDLAAQSAAQASRLEELERVLEGRQRQIRDLQLHSEKAAALAAAQREVAARADAERERLLARIGELEAGSAAATQRSKALQAENAGLRQELAAKDVSWQDRLAQNESLHASRLRARQKYFQEILAKRDAQSHRLTVNQRIRELVRASLPSDAHVLVISKGDNDLLHLDGRHAAHFPQAAGGVYAGYHPADSTEAIAQLEALKARGAEFLLIPAASRWWLEYYVEFSQHLVGHCSLLLYEEDTCLIYALRAPAKKRTLPFTTAARNGESSESRLLPRLSDATPASAAPARLPVPTGNGASQAERASLGVILDEFTTGCLLPEARLITFRPDNWRSVLERPRAELPDAIFVESAWRGNDGSWQYRIANYHRDMGNEIADLLEWTKQQAIPSIFWNKEDPVHFDRFIERARLFSHVFTTDANCISRYRERLGHDRVFALPFAAQPAIHNPVQDEEPARRGAVCFAGTYYGSRHQERQIDMDYVLRPAIPFGLEIYDRQHGMNGKDAANFRFPDVYQTCIKGRLDYHEMVKAYKRYRVFLNVNSVKQSPTMFSRRVFELLACGTPVISTFSQGIMELLGEDVVFFTESEADTRRHLERLLGDEDEWARASARGIRKVMSEHTYGNRMREVFERVGVDLPQPQEPRISVVIRLSSEADLPAVAEMLTAQHYRSFDLILIADQELSASAVQNLHNRLAAIPVRILIGQPSALFEQFLVSAEDYLAFVDVRDSYGPNFLLDHALAARYSGAEFLGKHTFYQADASGERQLRQRGYEFKYVTSVESATLLAKKRSLSMELFVQVLTRRLFQPGGAVLSVDRFNYLQNTRIGGMPTPASMEGLASHLEVYA